MAWTYEQRSGLLYDAGGVLVSVGYSGHGDDVNRPESEAKIGLGPIPAGRWRIGDEFSSDTRGHVVLPLTPVGHDAHGRSGFLVHGDSREHPGEASHGCIILPRQVRELLSDSEDRDLLVVAIAVQTSA